MTPDQMDDEALLIACECGNLAALLAVLAGRLDDLPNKCPSTVLAVYASCFIAETLHGRMNKLAEALP